MFAMDNIIRRAVQAAITILIPGVWCLGFKPGSEGDKANSQL